MLMIGNMPIGHAKNTLAILEKLVYITFMQIYANPRKYCAYLARLAFRKLA